MAKQSGADGGNKRNAAASGPRPAAGRAVPSSAAGKASSGRAPSGKTAPARNATGHQPAPRSGAPRANGSRPAAAKAPAPRPKAPQSGNARATPQRSNGARPAPRPAPRSGGSGGRPPGGAVYRRRRLVLGFFALLVVGALAAAGMTISQLFTSESPAAAPAASEAASAPTAASHTSAAPTATPSSTAPATPVCDESLVTVAGSLDASSYAPGVEPVLTLKVTNGGTVACSVNVGTNQMEYLITSGTDRIFSSRDCQDGGSDLVKSLAPGASETANFTWKRKRSAPGCGHIEATPGGGGAYYVLKVSLGSRTSPNAAFQLQ